VRVMGVDPGLTRCGLSIIESGRGRQVIALDVDVVRTPADQPLHKRLLTISDAVEHWLDTHHPDVLAIERVFANQNANTAMGTAQAGGVIALAAARRDIDVHFHTPSEVKAAVTGNGRADKAQVTEMVTRILALQTKPTPADAADALAGHLPLLAGPDDRADGRGGGHGRRATAQVQGQAQGGPMIASVRGEVLDIALDHVVIEAAGVGYKVMTTPSTLATLRRGTEARLIIAMIVREDSMTLYGFADAESRDLFSTLLGVSGVGPKIGLATLAVYDAQALRQALADGDVTALTRVPGIGKRGAERLVLELRDKIGPVTPGGGLIGISGHAVRAPVVEALVGLGFAAKQAEEATDKVLASEPDATTQTALRSALSLLGKK
jgi:Holliday junction DNA helicase RuvA